MLGNEKENSKLPHEPGVRGGAFKVKKKGTNAMKKWLAVATMLLFLTGCATHVDPGRPFSKDFPLSYTDVFEIKESAAKHREILGQHKLYLQPELALYVTGIGYRLVAASNRPHLPYHFFILDEDEVDLYSVGGGYVYVTRGLLEFVDSEAELAGALAHEIAHISAGAYTPEIKEKKRTKKQLFFRAVGTGVGAAAGAVGSIVGGPVGDAAGSAMGEVKDAVPSIRRQFQASEELKTDEQAMLYLLKTNYDPRDYARYLDKLSKIHVADIMAYINYLSSHPPYEERQALVAEMLQGINFKAREFKSFSERFIEVRASMLPVGEVRISAPQILGEAPPAADPPPAAII